MESAHVDIVGPTIEVTTGDAAHSMIVMERASRLQRPHRSKATEEAKYFP